MKKETLEEAAERHHDTFPRDLSFAETRKESFIKGAKWQQERMYSEKEVLELLLRQPFNMEINIKEWFKDNKKQFKTKKS